MPAKALSSMLGVLAPLRVYNLGAGSLVAAELAAYGAAFAVLEEELAAIRRDAFLQHAGGAALRSFEALVGLPLREDMDDATRRELVIYRMSVAPYDFTAQKMLGSMRAAGIEAELVEDPANERLIVKSAALLDPTLTIDIAKSRLAALVPAHLEWELDFGFTTWIHFDALGYSCAQHDALDTPWESLDTRIQNLLGL